MKLKACPWCGSKVRIFLTKIEGGHNGEVGCQNCGINVQIGIFGDGLSRQFIREYICKVYNHRYKGEHNG